MTHDGHYFFRYFFLNCSDFIGVLIDSYKGGLIKGPKSPNVAT